MDPLWLIPIAVLALLALWVAFDGDTIEDEPPTLNTKGKDE